MPNELTLVLETEIEQLTPKLIAFNNEELMQAVSEQLKHYENVEYSDDQIDQAKKDRAQLNAFSIALNSERIRIGKIYTAPYEKFKSQVDEVIAKVKAVSSSIDQCVKEAENKAKAEKQAQIKGYFDSMIKDYSSCIPFERILQPKWLNASTSLKTVFAEIDDFISRVDEAMVAIDALDESDREYIRTYYFRSFDLASALMEQQRMKREREEVERLRKLKEAENKAKAEKKEQISQAVAVNESQVMQVDPEQVVRFEVHANLHQLKELKDFLQSRNIKYYAI